MLFYHAGGCEAINFLFQIDTILALDAREINAGELAQAQEQLFFQSGLRGYRLQAFDGAFAGGNCGDVRSGIAEVAPALVAGEGVSARTKTEVGFAAPIFQVVLRSVAGLGSVGNFVLLVADRAQFALCQFVKIGHGLFAG